MCYNECDIDHIRAFCFDFPTNSLINMWDVEVCNLTCIITTIMCGIACTAIKQETLINERISSYYPSPITSS